MNIHDIITVKGPTPSKAAADKISDLVQRTQDALGWYRVIGRQHSQIEKLEELASELRGSRMDILLEHGYLPKPLRKSLYVEYQANRYGERADVREHGFDEDAVTRVADAPKTSLSSLRDLASKFGFPIIPIDYVSEDVRRPAEKMAYELEIRSGLGFQTYIMGPMGIYSAQNHSDSDVDLPVYSAGTSLAAALLTIPALRSLKREMIELRDQVRDIDKRLGRVAQDVKGLQEQVSLLSEEVASARRDAALARSAADRASFQALSRLQSSAFYLEDPIAVSIPPGMKIAGDGWAVIGPCWGPDFEQIVFESLDLKVKPNQRKSLQKRWPLQLPTRY